jgi:uncharacterized YigZ family protein
MIIDHYFTINHISEGEFKDKGSKFLAYTFPFGNSENLKTNLDQLRANHPKARHFCYAYKIGLNNEHSRSNDDGEPSGSAGKPILNAILSKNISDILIVVVRYFGGTLLGVPGLINAYKSAALEAISNSTITTKYVYKTIHLKYDFAKTNDIMRIIKDLDLKIIGQDYTDKCEIQLAIRLSQIEKVNQKFEDLRIIEIEIN